MKIKDILTILKTAPRSGTDKDEPEGSRYITLSDTLVNKITTYLSEQTLADAEDNSCIHKRICKWIAQKGCGGCDYWAGQ